jgi:hypothetical protein
MPSPARVPLATALAALAVFWAYAPVSAQRLAGQGVPSPAGTATRSLVLPGWGQRALGQRRSLAYAAAEAVAWGFWIERRGKGADLREAYRDLAWTAARLRIGSRADGPWPYYEALSKWTRSGAFDRDPSAPGVQPEEDPATFNGSAWALARQLHFRGGKPVPGDPTWEAALTWYRTHAYGEAFLWDWTGRREELAEYQRLIHDSDDRFRQATAALGVVLANHLLAGTDAFVSARLSGRAQLRVGPAASALGGQVSLTLRWAPSR